jgi:hypothetical protein
MLPLSSSAGSLGSLPLVITCNGTRNKHVNTLILKQYCTYATATKDNRKLCI